MNCLLLTPNPTNSELNESAISPNKPIYLEKYCINDERQVKHINQVLKLSQGDSIKVGIKGGCLGSAVIDKMDDGFVQLKNINCQQPPPKKMNLTIILALCRPKVLRRLIMDMTAIGVERIVIVNSYRSQKSYWQSPLLARIDEFIDEGLQQGVDTIAPVVDLYKRFKPFVEDDLAKWINESTTISAIVAHPYANQSFDQYLHRQSFDNLQSQSKQSQDFKDFKANLASYYIEQIHQNLPQYICIGSEGGWIDYEVALLKSIGCTPVSLGSRILRTEAVVNVLCGRYVCATVEHQKK